MQNNEHGGEGEERRQNDRSPRLAGTPTAPYSSLEKGGAVSPVRSITPEVIQVGFVSFPSFISPFVNSIEQLTRIRTRTVYNAISEISPFDISLSVESRIGKELIYLFIIIFFGKYNREVEVFIEYFVARRSEDRRIGELFFVKIFDGIFGVEEEEEEEATKVSK